MTQSSAPAVQISRKGMYIWIGLIIFISFWMFVLGVMVGRGMAPVNLETGKLEKELADLKAKMLDQGGEEVTSQDEGKAGEKPQLGFYEALKNPDKQTEFKPATPVKPPVTRTMPVPPMPEAKPAPPEPKARPASPVPVAKPEPKPQAAPAPVVKPLPRKDAPSYFAVQVASVQDSKGAEKLVSDLRNKGYQAYQIRSEVPGKGVWHRIRVGGFEERAAAEKMLKKLKSDKFDGMVVSTK